MSIASDIEWRDHVVLTRELELQSDRAAFYAAVRRGEYTVIHRGVYARSEYWTPLDRHARYRLRIMAASMHAADDLVVSHDSAAAVWRLPRIGSWPTRVHVISGEDGRTHSTSMLIRHPVPVPEVLMRIDGMLTTGLTRTAVDIAATVPFGPAVAMVDAALRRTLHPFDGVPETSVTRNDLLEVLESVPLRHGSARARRTIEFSDGLADRPGESISRVNMRVARLTAPQLQVPLNGASGRVYTVDFWWPDFGHIGEFDGRYKYSDPEFLRGRTPQQVLFDEKLREDDLRAAGHGMSRWPWEVASSPRRLAALLTAAGIR